MRRGLFRCDCGNEKPMGLHHVKHGRTISCGCENARRSSSRFTKHGAYKTSTYKSWNAMIQRCHNPNSTSYAQYGGRGISVCIQWAGADGYLQFARDVGERPNGTTLDRIDSNGNYEPGNVRWATPKTQQNNRRITKLITHDGVTLSQSEWAERLGLSRNAISERLRAGWSVERALTEPGRRCGGAQSKLACPT
jgi:hypothetical protein